MDKTKRALELLNECLGEIPKLRRLGYDSPESKLWYEKVQSIIKDALDLDDYRKFFSIKPAYGGFSESTLQRIYLRRLTRHETALKSILQKYEIRERLGSETEPITTSPKDTTEVAIHLFNRMQFHPDIVAASKSLFRDRHYAQAILEAFKAVNNFVKDKSGLSPNELRGIKDRPLMAKVFDEKEPLIKLNELITDTDINEQEGFKLLYMGATEGIRNPKAHDMIEMKDPYKTLEYLAFASLLMRRIEEGKVVRTSQSRRKWDWDSFIKDTKNKCEQKIIDLTKNLYDFTSVNSDSISWGTGINDGSFTFRKLSINGEISIFSVYSCGWVYINFGSMINKTVPDSIIETFRTSLNSIPNINIPKSAITDGKYARIYENPLTNSNNLQIFKDAVISLCQQLENN